MQELKLGLWRNKKTKGTYIVTGRRINSTNAQNGQCMVMYHSTHKTDDEFGYVREISEFLEKFEKI